MELTDDAKDAQRQMLEQEIESHIIWVVLAQQYNLRKGLELFGDRAEAAVDVELSQIHSLNAFVPKFAKDLSYEQKNKAFESLLFITEKRNGNIKGRSVADGSKQQSYDGYEKSDGSSFMVMTDSVYLMGTIAYSSQKREMAISREEAWRMGANSNRMTDMRSQMDHRSWL